MGSAWLKEYPENWPEISEKVRQRDGWRCVTCGVKHLSVIRRKRYEEYVLWSENETYQEAIEAKKKAQQVTRKKHIVVVIHACHIENPSPFDCRPENLKSLCQMHHHWVDNELRAKTRRETWIRKKAKKNAASEPIAAPVATISPEQDDTGWDLFCGGSDLLAPRLHGRNWGAVSSTGQAHGHPLVDDYAAHKRIGTLPRPVPTQSFVGRFVALAWAWLKGKRR